MEIYLIPIGLVVLAAVLFFVTKRKKAKADAAPARPTASELVFGKVMPSHAPAIEYYRRHPGEKPGAGLLVIDAGRFWDVMNSVNRIVNSHPYSTDNGDEWGWGVGFDCDDYAITKRRNLVSAGLGRNSLRLATCKTDIGYHVALLVITPEGAYLMDNLTDEIRDWKSAGYTEWWAEDYAGNWCEVS